MSATSKVTVAGIWALSIAAAFAFGRSTAPGERDPAPENLAAAIESALGEPDVLDRAEQTARLLQHLGPENVEAVAEVYDRMLNLLGELSLRPFVAAWARFDPAAAFEHTLRWRYQDKKEMGAGAALEAWALRDPASALEAYERVSKNNPALMDTLFFDLLTGWVYSDQEGVEAYVSKLPIGILDTAVTRIAAKILRNQGAEGLLRWADKNVASEDFTAKMRRKIFQRTTRMVARWEPELAAKWVMRHRGQDYAADGPRIVAEQWGPQNGPAAIAWVREHPDEDLRHTAAREGFRTWFESDRAAALEWLEAQELGEFHDPMIVFFAKEHVYRDAPDAVSWCERVSDEGRRLACLEKTASIWYRRDPEAAEVWLQQSPLGEAGRSSVRTPPEPKLKPQPRRRNTGAAQTEQP